MTITLTMIIPLRESSIQMQQIRFGLLLSEKAEESSTKFLVDLGRVQLWTFIWNKKLLMCFWTPQALLPLDAMAGER